MPDRILTEKQYREGLEAAEKHLDGEKLSGAERKSLQKLKEQHFYDISERLPKRIYRQLSGRENSQLDSTSKYYGIPLATAEIHLGDAITALHDWMADNAQKIKRIADADTIKKAAEAKLLEIKTQQAELDLRQRMDEMIERRLVREKFAWLASQFSAMAEQVGRNHGPDPQAAINGFIEIMQRELEEGGKLDA